MFGGMRRVVVIECALLIQVAPLIEPDNAIQSQKRRLACLLVFSQWELKLSRFTLPIN